MNNSSIVDCIALISFLSWGNKHMHCHYILLPEIEWANSDQQKYQKVEVVTREDVGCVCYGYEKIKIKVKLLDPWKFPRVPLVYIYIIQTIRFDERVTLHCKTIPVFTLICWELDFQEFGRKKCPQYIF